MSTNRNVKHEPAALARFLEFISDRPPGSHYYASLLGLKAFDWPHLMRAVEHGFAYDAFDVLRQASGLSSDAISAWLQLPQRTLTRRKQQRRFAPDESDRLLRAARVLGRALELFEGDRSAAIEWLTSPLPALGDEQPIEVARTEVGAREVENLIGRIEHGVYS